MKAMLLVGALALALIGCKGEQAGADPASSSVATGAVHAESGLALIPVTITSQGKVHRFTAELAQTPEQQAKGLMFRTRLGPDEGMLFPFNPPKAASFWMRNTVISLDLVFIAPDGRVTNVAANAQPYDETKLLSKGLVKAVLELPGGRAAELGITAGDGAAW